MTRTEDMEDAAARLIVEALKQARVLYPDASAKAVELMARLLLMRSAAVLRQEGNES